MTTLGAFIKRNRKRHGLTQRQLAELVDTHHTTISHLESDRIIVGNDLIERIAAQICDNEYHQEQMYIIGGVFDMKAITQLASSDPLICRLLRRLPTLPEHKIVAIYEVMK